MRNRARVIEAARAVFAAAGPAGSLEAVARKAGVGVGTLYRHFPTREALFEAVYREEVESLVALAARLGAEAPPLEALRLWVRATVAFVATKKGMYAALAGVAPAPSDLTARAFARLCEALDALLRRAAEAGAIRGDMGAEDVLRPVFGICSMYDRPDWQEHVGRLLDVFLDGMTRPQPRPV